MKRIYVIVPTRRLTERMIESCAQTSIDSARKSNDQSQSLLKYEGTKPRCLRGYRIYSYKEILRVMKTDAWVEVDYMDASYRRLKAKKLLPWILIAAAIVGTAVYFLT